MCNTFNKRHSEVGPSVHTKVINMFQNDNWKLKLTAKLIIATNVHEIQLSKTIVSLANSNILIFNSVWLR